MAPLSPRWSTPECEILMSQKLANKVALVTGGTSGIGLATAKLFVAEGAHVFITGRRQTELNAAAKALGRNATAIQSDVANLADLDRLSATIQEQKLQLDVLFANAGGGSLAPLGQITEEHFDKTFNTNVRGLLFSVQKSLPLMQPGSSIILNASIVSIKGTPAFSVYSATKAAVPTPGYDLLGLTKEQVQGFVDTQLATIPLGRVGTPDEIAKAVVFLASDDSSYINGIELFVDGGMAQI